MEILTQCYSEVSNMYRCFLSAQHFPDPQSTALLYAVPYWADPLAADFEPEWWFRGYVTPGQTLRYFE